MLEIQRLIKEGHAERSACTGTTLSTCLDGGPLRIKELLFVGFNL